MHKVELAMPVMTEELFATIADAVAAGSTLAGALEVLDVRDCTFRRYMNADPARTMHMVRARIDAAGTLADESKTIADTDPDPQRARNRIDVRWRLAKAFNPRQFGDKLDLTVTEKVDPGAAHARALARIEAMRGPRTIEHVDNSQDPAEMPALTSKSLIP